MKKWILALMVIVLSTGQVFAADWVDQGDGTWQVSVTMTAATTQAKDDLEMVRADDNQAYFYSGEERDASTWLKEKLEGFASTREVKSVSGENQSWWSRFKRRYLSRVVIRDSADSGDTEARAVTVPSPIAAP